MPLGGAVQAMGGLVPAPSQVYRAGSSPFEETAGLVRAKVSAAPAGALSVMAMAVPATSESSGRAMSLMVECILSSAQ